MPKKSDDIDNLRAPFDSAITWLIFLIASEGLPLIVYETLRSSERQEHLKKKGMSKAAAGESPHNYGLACDFVLDTDAINVQEREWKGRMYPDAWDYTTPHAKAVYDRLGELAESINLEWGGRWRFRDVPHVQMPKWRRFLKKQNGKL